MTNSVLAYATYLPFWRVDPASRGKAGRIVASFDEDAIKLDADGHGEVLLETAQIVSSDSRRRRAPSRKT